jgi:small nuclear ribonucleoprotein (snRNP)-like protein
MPPSDATGRELKYIRGLKESVRPLVVHLLDGTEVRGHIEYYDTHMIKITRPEGPHFFVRKADIRYIVEDG